MLQHEIPEGGIITAFPAVRVHLTRVPLCTESCSQGEEEPSTQNVQDTQVTMDGFGDNAMEQDDTGPPSSSAKNDKITLVIRSQEGPCAFACFSLSDRTRHIYRIVAFNIKVARGKSLKLAFEKAHVRPLHGNV
jgi:hypothetical protein